jgi:hypothetical protein
MNQPKENKYCLCDQTSGLIMVYCPVCLLNFPEITNLKKIENEKKSNNKKIQSIND